jgi:hypothetical protein
MMRPVRKCPRCNITLRYREILPAGHFSCPVCHVQLQAPKSYAVWIAAINALGFRNLHLFWALLLAWWPLEFFFVNAGRYMVPPKVQVAAPEKAVSDVLRDAKNNISEILRDKPLALNLNNKKKS